MSKKLRINVKYPVFVLEDAYQGILKCGFPLAEDYERSQKLFSHTRLGVWVQVCGGF